MESYIPVWTGVGDFSFLSASTSRSWRTLCGLLLGVSLRCGGNATRRAPLCGYSSGVKSSRQIGKLRYPDPVKLIEVKSKENFRLFVRYDDGANGEVDLSAYAGRGVFDAWLKPGMFEQVRLADAGHPAWPGGIDLCPDALYMKLTGKRPEEVFPTLNHLSAHA